MSESLRNDGRIWVPMDPDDTRPANQIPEDERDYYLERIYPSFGNLAPRDVASRAAMRMIDANRGVGPLKNGVYLDFADAIARLGKDTIEARYGNLFEMYERITDEDPYEVPMRIYPAPHYTMGGLWVDYNLMTTVPGLYAIGEANFSDHGANRLGASALMQGLADGYFVIPYTIGDYLADYLNTEPVPTDDPVFKEAEQRSPRPGQRAACRSTARRTVDDFHRELGKIMIEQCGMSRSAPGSRRRSARSRRSSEEFSHDVKVLGDDESLNQNLEKAGPGARLLRARRADVPRCARPRGVVRRPLPGRAPDRGRRGDARRRGLRPRLGVGVGRRRRRPDANTGKSSSSNT